MPVNDDWKDYAACRDRGDALFFGPDVEHPFDREDREAQAKRVCAGCLVRSACLADAIGRTERHGVWGGKTEDERWTDRRNDRRRALAKKAAAA